MKILDAGAGGIGGYYGARLAAAGHDVMFLARGRNLKALREQGLEIRSDLGDLRLEHVHAVEHGSDAGTAEAVLFCVKTYDNESAAAALEGVVAPDTLVCSLQNGVDNEGFLKARFPQAVVLGGTTRLAAWLEEPGVVVQLGSQASVTLGAFEIDKRPAAAALGVAFDSAGVPVTLASDIRAALWLKLLGISGVGGVTAYCGCALGEALADPDLRRLMADACREVAAVATARGIHLPDGATEAVITHVESTLDKAFRSSMARDAEAGRPLEIEALNGAVVRYGEESGVPTPANRRILDRLLPLHRAAMASREHR